MMMMLILILIMIVIMMMPVGNHEDNRDGVDDVDDDIE